MNSHQLFRRSRIRLALWYAGAMGIILSLSAIGMYRALIQSNWAAMEREMESIAGTLHDSLEPMIPISENPTTVLQRILPELCLVQQPCSDRPTLIQRHTIGISDRNTYYLRLFDHHGQLLAYSPNQPAALPPTLQTPPWQTLQSTSGIRYRQFTIILHSAHNHPTDSTSQPHSSWGYLQLGRTLQPVDAEITRMQWIFLIGFPIALGVVAVSSWALAGLAMQPIYQSYQQQQQFTANAAHELRSPLASLLATVEAILRVPRSNPQEVQNMLHTVERQGRRLSHLIADLLLLSSLEQHTSPKPFKPCCLNDLISDLTEEFLELATLAEVKLIHHVAKQEVYVLGNESQLYRLVSNLMANAIQYTPKGGQVSVDLICRERTACIAVKDTGIGIATAEQTRIFNRFYRVDSDRSRQTGGAGLGLSIVQAIVQAHSGKIQVQSELGKGSLFMVRLPLHQIHQIHQKKAVS